MFNVLMKGEWSCMHCHAKIVPGENCTGRYNFRPVQFLRDSTPLPALIGHGKHIVC